MRPNPQLAQRIGLPEAVLWGVILVAGCQQLLGIDEGKSNRSSGSPSGGGGATSDGGSGGDGGDVTSNAGGGGATAASGGAPGTGGGGGTGGSGPTAPVDWSSSMTALYLFEDVDDPGKATVGPTLSETGVLDLDPASPAQGSASLRIMPAGGELFGTAFPDVGSDITFGGWFRVEDTTNRQLLISRNQTGVGYQLHREVDGAVTCVMNQGSAPLQASAASALPVQTWVHLVCRFKSLGEAQVLVNGVYPGNASAGGEGFANSGTFRIGTSLAADRLEGLVDEVFVTGDHLSNEAIARIYACGVDGTACTCDGTSYVDCGRFTPLCAPLATHDCSAAAPDTR